MYFRGKTNQVCRHGITCVLLKQDCTEVDFWCWSSASSVIQFTVDLYYFFNLLDLSHERLTGMCQELNLSPHGAPNVFGDYGDRVRLQEVQCELNILIADGRASCLRTLMTDHETTAKNFCC